jgi:hypothetical protein
MRHDSSISIECVKGFSISVWSKLDEMSISFISPISFAAISGPQLAALSAASIIGPQLMRLGAQCAAFTAEQIAQLGSSSHTYGACLGISAACISAITAAAIGTINATCIQHISSSTFAALSADQLAAISPAAVSSISRTQLAVLGAQCSGFTEEQIAELGSFSSPLKADYDLK